MCKGPFMKKFKHEILKVSISLRPNGGDNTADIRNLMVIGLE